MSRQEIENWESFQERIKHFPEHDRWEIDFAYQDGKAYFRDKFRESGERYFEHVRGVAIIILDEYKLDDPDMVKAALHHDHPEDTPHSGNPLFLPYAEIGRRTIYRYSKSYNPGVAHMVWSVTNPFVDNVEIFTKEQAQQIGLDKLKASESKCKVLKSADRLHNLRDIGGIKDEERRFKKFIETRDHYFPIFEMARKDYPQVIDYALEEMVKAMAKWGFVVN